MMSKNKNMKKLISLLAAFCMTTALTGCGDSKAQCVCALNIEKYVTVGDYKNIEVSVDAYEVDESYKDYVKSSLMSNVSMWVDTSEDNLIVNRAVQNGDLISLDYAGYKDGVAFDGGTAANQTLGIGSGSFIDGFEDGLVGVKPGETVDLNLTFPENYGNEELNGAEVVFTVTVHGIIPEEVIYAAISDNVLEEGEARITNEAEMDLYVADYVNDLYESYQQEDIEDAIVNELVGMTTQKKDFPKQLVELYKERAEASIRETATSYGVDVDTLCNYFYGCTMEEYLSGDDCDKSLLIDAAMQYVASKEGLSIPESKLQERLETFVAENGLESVEELTKEVSRDECWTFFMQDDVMKYLKDTVKITINE